MSTYPQLPITTTLIRLGVAVVLGGIIGLERERGERGAGIRTLALVSLGSALIMEVSAFGFADIVGTPGVGLDPSRIAAQVVSGIGFLGAGTILLRRQVVRGLTTAAAIWLVAGIGLACGAGLLAEGAIATGMALIVLAILHPLERKVFPRLGVHTILLKVENTQPPGDLLRSVSETCEQAGLSIESIEARSAASHQTIEMRCRSLNASAIGNATQKLYNLPGVREIAAEQITSGQRARLFREHRSNDDAPRERYTSSPRQ